MAHAPKLAPLPRTLPLDFAPTFFTLPVSLAHAGVVVVVGIHDTVLTSFLPLILCFMAAAAANEFFASARAIVGYARV